MPLLEIAGFVIVGKQIGVLATLALILLSTILGFTLLRRQGFNLLQKIKTETQAGRTPAREMIDGTMLMFAGILLIIPGFITDIIGLLLFIPFVRAIIWHHLVRKRIILTTASFNRSQNSSYNYNNQRNFEEDVVDLDPDEYTSSAKNKSSPWLKDKSDE